nr:unnamed protein product [Callosobruchus analis]
MPGVTDTVNFRKPCWIDVYCDCEELEAFHQRLSTPNSTNLLLLFQSICCLYAVCVRNIFFMDVLDYRHQKQVK